MFAGSVFLLPGQELREFAVLRPERRDTDEGRQIKHNESPAGCIRAVLAAARPDEKERWRQLEHPITHKIIMRYRQRFDVKPGDVFEYKTNGGSRRFVNQGMPYDVGDIGHWVIFYCEERTDVQ